MTTWKTTVLGGVAAKFFIWGERGEKDGYIAEINPYRKDARELAALIQAAPDLRDQLQALATQLEQSGMIVPPGVSAALAAANGETA